MSDGRIQRFRGQVMREAQDVATADAGQPAGAGDEQEAQRSHAADQVGIGAFGLASCQGPCVPVACPHIHSYPPPESGRWYAVSRGALPKTTGLARFCEKSGPIPVFLRASMNPRRCKRALDADE